MYTVKSVSNEGVYYLSKNWRKTKALWVSGTKLKQEMLFTSPVRAKLSLKKLLEVMTEYLNDEFSIVKVENGIETIEKINISSKTENWKTIVEIV